LKLREAANEQDKTPTYTVLPFVRRTMVRLKFARKTLEEFMDRYVRATNIVISHQNQA